MRMSAETMFRRLMGQGQDDTLGGRIWRARDAVDLTQDALARQLGLADAVVASWEADRAEPQTNSLFRLAGVLGVSPAWLIAGIGAGPDVPEAEMDGADDAPEATPSSPDSVERLQRDLERLKRQHAAMGATIHRIEATLSRLNADRSRLS